MRILFIGGTGNISTDCVEFLVREGHEVSCLTRGNRPVPENDAVCERVLGQNGGGPPSPVGNDGWRKLGC